MDESQAGYSLSLESIKLSRIASLVGTPIVTDTPTALKTRMSYARILVEVAADCAFPTEFPIQVDTVKL